MAVTAAACPPLTPVGGSWCHLFEQLCVSGVRDTFCITRLLPPEAVALKSTCQPSHPCHSLGTYHTCPVRGGGSVSFS